MKKISKRSTFTNLSVST